MPTIDQLRSGTFPVTVLGGDDPLILNVKRNARTRSGREALRAALQDMEKPLQETAAKADALHAQITKLELGDDIAEKMAALEGADEATTARLNEELAALRKKRDGNAPRIAKLMNEMQALVEPTREAAADTLAKQLDFYVESTNLKLTSDEDSPLVPADFDFFRNEFDLETLRDFSEKILAAISGPLADRGFSTS